MNASNSGLAHGTSGSPQTTIENGEAERKAVEQKNSFPGGRNREEYSDLARDPARGSKVTPGGQKERAVALDLEQQGKIGHVVRDPQGDKGADFIDTKTGQKWDIKSPVSHPHGHRSPRKGAFNVERMMANVKKEVSRGNNVILDTRRLTKADCQAFKKAIHSEKLDRFVLWYDRKGES